MKKYLMIGFAAVAFAACSNHDFETYTPEQMVKAEYDAKFIAEFGKPGPQQDWGFGATTRAFTRSINPDANMWANTYKVPTELTQAQKDLVRKFFQQNKLKFYDDPQLTNFFMQQVYKGGTTVPENCPTPEKYSSANGGLVTGSDHMDHLAACNEDGSIKDHIYNFNYGTCSTNDHVSNTPGVTYNRLNGSYHYDEIQLALNSTTKKFGYFNSEGSLGHTEYTSLVSWQRIAQWAMDNHIENITDINQSILSDGWNRSFMGFDFESIAGEDIFARTNDNMVDEKGNIVYEYDGVTPKKAIKYLTYGDLIDGPNYVWDGGDYAVERPSAETPILYNGKKIPLLDTRTNMYCGIDRNLGQDQAIYRVRKNFQRSATQIEEVEAVNLTIIFNQLQETSTKAKYYPVDEKGVMKWVEVKGGADQYYSDWIVTLTKAEEVDNTNYAGRIMAEDLTPNSSSDWDFNDVVFDFGFEGNAAVIKLQAAGGTLPLTIGGSPKADNPNEPILDENGNVANGQEVHGLFGLNNTSTMINTGAGATLDPVKVRLTDKTYTQASDIMICVKKKVEGVEKWIVINAFQGEPAAKFVTNTNVDWVDEFANIKYAYGNFTQYVESGSGKFVPTSKDEDYFDRVMRNEKVAPAQQ